MKQIKDTHWQYSKRSYQILEVVRSTEF